MPARPSAYAVIVAGGKGMRMGTDVPKQFLQLRGKPVLYHSIRAFKEALPDVLHIILVVPRAQQSLVKFVENALDGLIEVKVVSGGETRYESVAAGLREVPEAGAIVMVHDGARPLVTPDLIRRCYEAARTHGSAVPVLPVSDSIRQVSGYSSRAIAREDLRSVQTPQAFESGLLHAAFRQDYLPSFTDEASVVEWTGATVHLIEGMRSNLKITTPDDMLIAEALLGQRK